MSELARAMPGYLSHKGYTAEDGERVTIVEFADATDLRAGATHPEHVATKRQGRASASLPNTGCRCARCRATARTAALVPHRSRRCMVRLTRAGLRRGVQQADVDLAVNKTPFGGCAQGGEQVVEGRSGIGRVLEPGDKIEGLGRGQVAAMV